MTTLEEIAIDVEETDLDPNQDLSAIADGDALDRPVRQPPSAAAVKINVEGAFIVDDDEIGDRNGVGSEHVHWEHKDIRLPHHTDVVSHVAVDIGGSLAKLVYFSREPGSRDGGGRLNFLNFETDRIDLCIDFIHELKIKQSKLNGSTPQQLCVMATGGGAFKFYNRMKEVLHVDVVQEDEMECLIIGLDFFITEIPQEVFTYSEEEPMQFAEARADIYPYLLVNIGSGVSMVKVSGPREFERVGGTSLGGGTFWGILSLLTGARTFDEMLALAERGDNSGVDMLVGDIYGTGYSKIGLKSTTIASTFGKVFRMKRMAERNAEDGEGLFNRDPRGDGEEEQTEEGFKIQDMARSLLFAISNNIGQIAYLQSEKHDLQHIYFGGSFIRGHTQTMNTLSYAIKFWSKGQKQAYFLRHEGYLGSVGAFLKRQPKNWGRRNSFEDTSSRLGKVLTRD
ncbi:hypothetical protein LTR84_007407 [Exophiala bonariae]|uniref:Pantothenate kinase n=1 Tax=Exophiala bonariae TaxID=1690606 RepID=A0AAV9N0B5_9EURO|nr:hypothetical protein LTR84_007407 [Exophiala bonariae]